MEKIGNITLYNADCMEVMKTFADKQFDLAIVDPPYGININHNMGRRKGEAKSMYSPAYWDKEIPKAEYFEELFRVAKQVIIWGGNYFPLPPTKCFIVWRKPQMSEGCSFSMLEYAWTNIDSTSKEFIGMSNEKIACIRHRNLSNYMSGFLINLQRRE